METLPRRVLVLGASRSGAAVARYLAAERDAGCDVTFAILDEADGPGPQRCAASLRSEARADVRLGVSEVGGEWDLIVASPGIPPHSAIMRSALSLGAPVISELEFASRRTRSPFVAVTGTNGKTTTTALVTHLLLEAGMPAEAVGNIGVPATTAARADGPVSVLVAEVSSFQLAFTTSFHPRVAVLLNVTPDHVDWHGSLEAYEADKAKVFSNMGPGDTAVIDIDDSGSAPWAEKVEAQGVRVARVSRSVLSPGGAALVDGMLTIDTSTGAAGLVPAGELRIRGDHNVSNALAASAAAHALGAPLEAIREGLRTFAPIEHRLEPAGVVGDVEYCNDSKATNPDAVLKALTAFGERPIILLLGGRNKGNDFTPLATAVAARCKTAVLFGEALGQLREAFAGTGCRTLEAPDLAGAVGIAAETARPGDVVLLSPACASFDEFRSYEHRGEVFKGLVESMEGLRPSGATGSRQPGDEAASPA